MMYHRACCCNPDTMYCAMTWTGLVTEWITSPFAVFRNSVDYDTRTRIYRIDNGMVKWVSSRPDEPPANPATIDGSGNFTPIDTSEIASLDFNTHGLYLTRFKRYLAEGTPPLLITSFDHAIEKVDVTDGSVPASIQANYGTTQRPVTVHICANLAHVFLLSEIYDNGSGNAINWKRLDADLVQIATGDYTGPFVDATDPQYTTAAPGFHGFGRPVIRPDGNIHHYNLILDRDDLTSALEHRTAVGPQGATYFTHRGGVIAIDSSSNVVGGESGQPSVFLRQGAFVDTTGAYRSLADSPPEAARGPSPLGSELLYKVDGTIYGYATYPPDSAIGMELLWTLDLLPLLEAHVLTLSRPAIPTGSTLRITSICHSGESSKIRVMGYHYKYEVNGNGDSVYTHFTVFITELTRGFGASGTAVVNWYLDSAHTEPGEIAIEAPAIPRDPVSPSFPGFHDIIMTGDTASGVMGSGVDYEYAPTN